MGLGAADRLFFFGALAGGIVNGLTGFGTALTALGIWLFAIPPTVAATLVILCSVVSQLQTLPMIWRTILWKRVVVFVAPGVLGVPIGTFLLPHIDPRMFKIGVGVFLVVYSAYVLMRRVEVKTAWGGRTRRRRGRFLRRHSRRIAGLSGVLPVVWTDIAAGPRSSGAAWCNFSIWQSCRSPWCRMPYRDC